MFALVTLETTEGAALVRTLESTTPGERVRLAQEQIVWSSSKAFAAAITATDFVIKGRGIVLHGRLRIRGKDLDHIILRTKEK